MEECKERNNYKKYCKKFNEIIYNIYDFRIFWYA